MVDEPQGRGEIRDLLARHDLRPRKALGQHFLADPNVIRRMVRLAAVGPGDRVLEVGAGTGTLTRALAATGARVRSYEVDRRLEPVLTEALAGVDVDLRFADVMQVDLAVDLDSGPWTMVANLPYNIGTPLVMRLLREAPQVCRYVVMVQREVADRLRAPPGGKDYGLPSVVTALHGTVSWGFKVGPDVFVPPPQVDSAVVVVERFEAVDADAAAAISLAAAAFGQRRKMVRRSLRPVVDDPEGLCAAAGIDPVARADHLAPGDYLLLAKEFRAS